MRTIRWHLVVFVLLASCLPALAAPAQSFIYIGVVSCATSLWDCSSELRVYDARSTALVTRIALPFGYQQAHIALSPDGTRLYVSSSLYTERATATLSVIDATRHRLMRRVALPIGASGPVAVRFDGSRVYLAGIESMGIVDTNTWQVTTLPWAVNGSRSLAAHPFLDRLYLGERTFTLSGVVDALRELDGDGLALRELPGPIQFPVVSSDGAHLLVVLDAVAGRTGSAVLIDTGTFSEIARYSTASTASGSPYPIMAVEDVARRVVYLATAAGLATLYRAGGQVLSLLPVPGTIQRMVLSADGSRVWMLGRTFGSGTNPPYSNFAAIDLDARRVVRSQSTFERLSDIAATPATASAACSYRVNSHDLAFGVNGGVSSLTLAASCDWEASTDAPWLRLSATQGAGATTLILTVDPNFTTTNRSGVATIAGQEVRVSQASFSAVPAFGVIDTPVDNTLGVSGSLPVTGWALDDVGVTRVRVVRDPVAGEGAAAIAIGEATFVDGARPDVAAAYPSLPNQTRAGWGLMVLTNMLPGGGNGTYRLTAYADDAEGHTTWLGTRTFTAANSTATLPFGAIDTPAQGEVVSGTIVNFGWALTPPSSVIPSDGSTIDVLIDGVVVGHPTYGNFRPDIAALFPGYANTAGAVGHFVIDTTLYANGVHTLAWVVRDSAGRAAGIGSRYFTIDNP